MELAASDLTFDIFEGDSRRGGIGMASVEVAVVPPELHIEFRAT
jgi:hypothetical protein